MAEYKSGGDTGRNCDGRFHQAQRRNRETPGGKGRPGLVFVTGNYRFRSTPESGRFCRGRRSRGKNGQRRGAGRPSGWQAGAGPETIPGGRQAGGLGRREQNGTEKIADTKRRKSRAGPVHRGIGARLGFRQNLSLFNRGYDKCHFLKRCLSPEKKAAGD
jgi:hypothetical protein